MRQELASWRGLAMGRAAVQVLGQRMRELLVLSSTLSVGLGVHRPKGRQNQLEKVMRLPLKSSHNYLW